MRYFGLRRYSHFIVLPEPRRHGDLAPTLTPSPCGEAGRWHLMTQLTSLDFLLAPICHNSQNWNILMAPWYDSKFNQERNSIQYPILRKVGAWNFSNSLQELSFKYQTFTTLKTKHLSKKAFILRKLFVQNSRNPVIHYEVDGRRWPLADPLILTYEAWCLTVRRQCHVHSDSHNLALNSNFKPRDGAEGGPAIRVKKESRVENYILLWFLI